MAYNTLNPSSTVVGVFRGMERDNYLKQRRLVFSEVENMVPRY